jgi:hypothetical protein
MAEKIHPLLSTISQELSCGFISDTFDVAGHKWTMQTPGEQEEIWINKFASDNGLVTYITSTRAARLAAVIKSIDGIPIESMFAYPDDMQQTEKDTLNRNPVEKMYWVLGQFLKFLTTGNHFPPPVLDALFNKWQELSTKRTSALEAKLPNFSTRTHAGESGASSLPGPESSPQIQP